MKKIDHKAPQGREISARLGQHKDECLYTSFTGNGRVKSNIGEKWGVFTP